MFWQAATAGGETARVVMVTITNDDDTADGGARRLFYYPGSVNGQPASAHPRKGDFSVTFGFN